MKKCPVSKCPVSKCVMRKYDPEHSQFGFTTGGSVAELKAECVEILFNGVLKPLKLQRCAQSPWDGK